MSDAKMLLKTAYDAGINFFDNAEGYEAGESEKIMGGAIHGLGLPRDTFAVSSKVFWGGSKQMQMSLNAKPVRDACDAALVRLKVDYLDLYFCQRPDNDTPIEEPDFTRSRVNANFNRCRALSCGTDGSHLKGVFATGCQVAGDKADTVSAANNFAAFTYFIDHTTRSCCAGPHQLYTGGGANSGFEPGWRLRRLSC